jgi:hypothetical protein
MDLAFTILLQMSIKGIENSGVWQDARPPLKGLKAYEQINLSRKGLI